MRSTGPATLSASTSLLSGGTTWSCRLVMTSVGHEILPRSGTIARSTSSKESNGFSGVFAYALSVLSGSAMSDPMPSMYSSPASMSAFTPALISSGTLTAALMNASPASSGWCVPSQPVSEPPIESPVTTTLPGTRASSFSSASSAAADQSLHDVVFMSSTVVPWPGNSGNSTAKPAAASACATPRIELQLPVKPWSTSAPCGPPSMLSGSAPGMIGAVTASSSLVRVVAGGLFPPVVGGGLPVRVREDAVDRTHRRQTLLAARAQLRDDDHVDPVVEDGAELRRTVADAGVAVDADRHVDHERWVLPLGIALPARHPRAPFARCHGVIVSGPPPLRLPRRSRRWSTLPEWTRIAASPHRAPSASSSCWSARRDCSPNGATPTRA